MLMLSCMQSAKIIWNYGRTGQGIYDPYYDSGEFSWSRIAGTDWLCSYSHDGWYNWTYSFYCGSASLCVYGKWGYLDCNGDVAIPMIYDEAGNFKDGRAEVQIEGERFYIDIKGLKL